MAIDKKTPTTAPGEIEPLSSPYKHEEDWLLKVVARAIRRAPDPRIAAAVILVDLPKLPALHSHLPDVQCYPRSDDLRGAIDRLAADIVSEFANPDRVSPERVVRAAMQALGCDPEFARRMYE